MATIVTTITTCDLPHEKETPAEGEPVLLALGANARQLDLCAPCQRKLEIAFGPYADCGRAAPKPFRRSPDRRVRRERVQAASKRAWAKANGISVADKGKLPNEALAAYDAAHGLARTA